MLIEVKAAGMNFRDVLKSLALYPGDAPDARIFGDEVSGIVKEIGIGCHAPRARRSCVWSRRLRNCNARHSARSETFDGFQQDLTFEAAATLPVVFMTAWYALRNVGRLRERRARPRSRRARVELEWPRSRSHCISEPMSSPLPVVPANVLLLKTLGVEHVIDSRRGDFAESVMKITDGKGVDVVLNALAAEAIPMGLSCLAEFGRFIEIGKRDIYQNSRIPLATTPQQRVVPRRRHGRDFPR